MVAASKRNRPFTLAEHTFAPGERGDLNLKVARLATGNWLSLPIVVLNGRYPGPTLWLDAAIHGDELNGLEIIHRLLEVLDPKKLRGTILAVPVVNVFGFVQQSRYLPDRRDLNRSFPGTRKGSLASRIANLFMREIVARADYGIDFHTGSQHRTNLPQIRAALTDPETRRIAEAFAAPVMFNASEIKGSLRGAARKQGAQILVYEAGEPHRFEEKAIKAGVNGTLRVLKELGMRRTAPRTKRVSFEAASTKWLRAGRSGILHIETRLGREVKKGERLGMISDVAGTNRLLVKAPSDGVIIGYSNNPLVYQGDAMIHLARS